MAHGAAQDAAQNIASSLVRGRDAIGDEEGGRAQMVGDDPVRGGGLALGGDAGRRFAGGDQGSEQVRMIDVGDTLQGGCDPLEAHAGVDARPGQRRARLARALVELHEDEIPDFGESVAVFLGRTGRTTGDGRPVVVEDLRARTARARLTHGPEVVVGGDADDLVVRQAGDLAPQPGGVLVGDMDCDQQLLGRQPEIAGDELPREFDRRLLEVVPEGEIAEHLEEGQVAAGVADIVEVVVLAARAHALLRRGEAGGRRGGLAGEDGLERDHAGIDEQQGRIVARHERRGWGHRMAACAEVARGRGRVCR